MTASVPWPRASAENLRIIQTQIGRAIGSNTKTGTRPFVSARAQAADRSSAHRNTRVPRPTQTPAAAPSSAHLSVLISSAVCSVYHRLSSARRGDSSRRVRRWKRANRSRRRGDIALPSLAEDNRADHGGHAAPAATARPCGEQVGRNVIAFCGPSSLPRRGVDDAKAEALFAALRREPALLHLANQR